MHHLLEIWFGWVLSGGYVGIIILMAMGSTPLPVPAEAVLPPAAFLAAQGKLNPVGVILAGTFGAYLGAAFMYSISRWIGRQLILRLGGAFWLGPGSEVIWSNRNSGPARTRLFTLSGADQVASYASSPLSPLFI